MRKMEMDEKVIDCLKMPIKGIVFAVNRESGYEKPQEYPAPLREK